MILPEFLWLPLMAGLGIAITAGPLGAFLVWQRMAYFGDSMAHATLLGVAIAMFFEVDMTFGILGLSLAFAFLLTLLAMQEKLPTDTLLASLAHASLAAGIVALSLLGTAQEVDLHSFLLGDILFVSKEQLYGVGGVMLACLGGIIWLWNRLLMVTLSPELSAAEGAHVFGTRLMLIGLLALFVTVSMQIIGVLLLTALLILPTATVSPYCRSPEAVAISASIAGAVNVTGGIWASYQWDLPATPAIVLCASLLWGLSMLKKNAV